MPNHKWLLVGFAGLSLFATIAFFNALAMVRAQENPGASLRAQPVDETSFFAENVAAMDKMMAGMNVKPTGEIDVDFTAMMIPHHQGAIDMAVAYLRYGKNEHAASRTGNHRRSAAGDRGDATGGRPASRAFGARAHTTVRAGLA